MEPINLILLTRAGCHLCEEMAAAVRVVGRETSFRFEEIDVDGDRALCDRYGEQVPVLLINGRRAFKYTLTVDALRRRLAAERRRGRLRSLRRFFSRPNMEE